MIDSTKLDSLDWSSIEKALNSDGYAQVEALLPESACAKLRDYYDDDHISFRSTIEMARFSFGEGQYQYFDYPLPEPIRMLREILYRPLAAIANRWSEALGNEERWPDTHDLFLAECHAHDQKRPTPLMLRYNAGGYNCLHRDLYGPIYFPLQAVFLLNRPGKDFDGGEFILVEQRPRMQSRPIVIPLGLGDLAIFPVRQRPRRGAKRIHRAEMRHGVGQIRRGRRMALGIPFHDAQ